MGLEKKILRQWRYLNLWRKLQQLNVYSCRFFFYRFKNTFDTVDHTIPLNILEHYGIRGLAFSWIQSYLTNRTQYVSIKDTNSTCINVTCGVPQGSILGPIIFITYINDMHTVSSLMKCIIFADDTNILYTGNDISEICKTVSKELYK